MATFYFSDMAEFIALQDRLPPEVVYAGSLNTNSTPLIYTIPDEFLSDVQEQVDGLSAGEPVPSFDPSDLRADIDALAGEVASFGGISAIPASIESINQRLAVSEAFLQGLVIPPAYDDSAIRTAINDVVTRLDAAERELDVIRGNRQTIVRSGVVATRRRDWTEAAKVIVSAAQAGEWMMTLNASWATRGRAVGALISLNGEMVAQSNVDGGYGSGESVVSISSTVTLSTGDDLRAYLIQDHTNSVNADFNFSGIKIF